MGRPRYDTDHALSDGALAAHEAGHGVIAKVQGVEVAYCMISAAGGGTRMRAVAAEHPEVELAVLLAGQEAAAYWLTRHSSYGFGSALRVVAAAAEHDLRQVRPICKRSGLSEHRARSRARSLVRRHWGRIDRATNRLYTHGRISGSAL